MRRQLALALLGRIVVLDVTPVDVRAGSGKAPLRIYARDGDDNTLTLTFFNNPAWAKKQLPLHEQRTVVGKLDSWGNEWQIVHPEVLEPGKVGEVPLREPVYGLTEGISNKRMRELALTGAGTRARAAGMDRAVAIGARSLACLALGIGRMSFRSERK